MVLFIWMESLEWREKIIEIKIGVKNHQFRDILIIPLPDHTKYMFQPIG